MISRSIAGGRFNCRVAGVCTEHGLGYNVIPELTWLKCNCHTLLHTVLERSNT